MATSSINRAKVVLLQQDESFKPNINSVMKMHTLKPYYLKAYFLLLFSLTLSSLTLAQLNLQVTVDSGTSTTTCNDNFGNPDPHWRVNVSNAGWTTYPATNFCYQNTPYLQYSAPYNCPADLPNYIEICFRAFEDDGSFCTPSQSCAETICQFFQVPPYGQAAPYTLGLAPGLSSGGSVNFTIEVTGTNLGPSNDFICNAIDFGVLTAGTIAGDVTTSAYNNICASSAFEPNPSPNGFFNEQGVWFRFTTDDDPNATYINAVSDPSNFGDIMNLQFALYTSDNGDCDGNLTLVHNSFTNSDGIDQSSQLICLEPNTNYFVLVDGSIVVPDQMEGYFGLEIINPGAVSAPDFKCDALDFGLIPDNGSVSFDNQSNHCATHPFFEPDPTGFVSQKSVWFRFEVPSSGHVIIEAESDPTGVDPIGLQMALYKSSNNTCNGFFSQIQSIYTLADFNETIERQCLEPETPLWIMIDGDGGNTSGIFNLTVSDGGPVLPQSTTDLDPVLCAGASIEIGGTTFNTAGPYAITIDAFNGCDSVISGVITILPPFSSTLDTMICSGQTVVVGTNSYSVSGNYIDVLQNADGCDSIVTTNLTVTGDLAISAFQTTEATNYQVADGVATCAPTGGSGAYTFLWSDGQTTQTATNLLGGTNYCVTVTDAIGCTAEDCTLVLFPSNILTTVEDVLLDCPGDTDGILNLSVSNGAAPYEYSWENLSSPANNGTGNIPTEGGTATLTNLLPGLHSFTISDAFGLTIATASVFEPTDIITNINPVLCAGESLLVGTSVYNTSGPISEVLISNLGCDSLVNGFVTVLNPITNVIDETICFGETLTVGNAIYNTTSTISETLTAYNGCDSIITGNLVVLPQNVTSVNAQICAGESIVINGVPYDQTGSYSETTTAFNFCDSIINLNLIVQDELLSNINLDMEASGPGLTDGIASVSPSGGDGNYTVIWSDGQSTNTATNLMAGDTYCVTISDGIGCTVEDCILVTFPSNIEVTAVNDTLDCFGDANGSILLDIEFGLAPYSYNWQNTDNSLNGAGVVNTQNGDATLSDLLPGDYFITVMDAFGEATTQAVVIEPTALAGVSNSTMTSCFNDCDGTAEITINGGTAPYQYFWPNGTINSISTGLCAGNYTVTVVDAKGCTFTENISVEQPTELVVTTGVLNQVSCSGGSDGSSIATLNGTAQSYLWDNGETTEIATSLNSGAHTVTIIDINGCSAVGTTNISEPSDPVILTIDLLREVSCFGGDDGSLLAVASGGSQPYQYEWDNGISSALSNALTAGTYIVTATDNNGCTVEAFATVSEPTEIFAEFNVTEVTCPEGELSGRIAVDTVYGGGGTYIYSIDGFNYSIDSVFSDLPADEYTLYVQDIEGCISEYPLTVNAPESILLELDDPMQVELGESIKLDPLYLNNNLVFEWTGLQPMDCTNCPEVETVPIANTIYELTATDTITGCTATAQQRVTILAKRDVYIPNAFSPNGDGVNDVFFIHAGPEVERITNLRVYNRWGAPMYDLTNGQPNDFRNGWDGKFKGQMVESGVYIYVAEIEFIDGERLRYEGDLTVVF